MGSGSVVCDAIRRRRLLAFSYDGLPRKAEPYCHGITRSGVELLRAYQVDGGSRSGEPVGWKMFDVHKMDGLRLAGEAFAPGRADYNPDDPHMRTVHCCI